MPKTKKKEEGTEIDLGVVKLNFGGLLNGMEKLVDLAERLQKTGGEIRREGEIDLSKLKEGMKGMYGLSIKSAVGGEPVVETFGNIKKTPEGPVVEEESEPVTDVFDEEKEIVVIAEVPGVEKEGIDLNLKGDILEIKAAGKNRKYQKDVLLPSKVKKKAMSYDCNNGILEVNFKK